MPNVPPLKPPTEEEKLEAEETLKRIDAILDRAGPYGEEIRARMRRSKLRLKKFQAQIKASGFESLSEAAEAASENPREFRQWSTNNPRRFELMLKGLAFERMNEQLNAAFEEIEGTDSSSGD
jgi:hypothetical protein